MTMLLDLRTRYKTVLSEHVAEVTNEELLHQAYELGRAAVTLGVSVLDMYQLHHEALSGIIAGSSQSDRAPRLAKAAEFFAESLSSFEMQLRGYRESNEELMQANERLKAAVQTVEQANRELERLAVTDPLTNCSNRRHFLAAAPLQIELSRPSRQQPALMLLDIDHFKEINDRYGHPVGDEALRRFADAVRGELRETDLFTRMGGEEFSIFLIVDHAANALKVAERIRARIAALTVESGNDRFGFTVSIGVSFHSGGAETLDQMLARADSALYKAKTSGRNCVCHSEGPVVHA